MPGEFNEANWCEHILKLWRHTETTAAAAKSFWKSLTFDIAEHFHTFSVNLCWIYVKISDFGVEKLLNLFDSKKIYHEVHL